MTLVADSIDYQFVAAAQLVVVVVVEKELLVLYFHMVYESIQASFVVDSCHHNCCKNSAVMSLLVESLALAAMMPSNLAIVPSFDLFGFVEFVVTFAFAPATSFQDDYFHSFAIDVLAIVDVVATSTHVKLMVIKDYLALMEVLVDDNSFDCNLFLPNLLLALPFVRALVAYSLAQLNFSPMVAVELMVMLLESGHWDLVYVGVEIDYLLAAAVERFVFVALVALLVTLQDVGSFVVDVDEATFVVVDSFVVIIEEMAHGTVDYFHVVVVVWQVLVLNWVNKLVLVVALLLAFQLFDFHNSAACCDPFDEASMQDYVLVIIVDDFVVSFAEHLLLIDAVRHSTRVTLMQLHVVPAMLNEIVGIGLVVCHVLNLRQPVGKLDSLLDVAIDVIAVVAADDFELFDLNAIESVELELAVIQLDLDSLSAHNPSDRAVYDHRRDVGLLLYGSFDVELHIRRMLVAWELVVVVSHTFDDRLADNVEIFSVGLAVDVEIEELMDNLVEESCYSSYSVVLNTLIAFVLDLVDN